MADTEFPQPPSIASPDAAPLVDAAPRRKRGRPPKDPNAPPRDRQPRRATTRAQLKTEISSLIALSNGLLKMSPYADDALLEHEINMLSDALTAECEAHPAILRWLKRASGLSPHLALVQAAIIIALPRLVRHGVITLPNSPTETPTDSTVSMETGPTYGDSGGYGLGQNNASSENAADAELHPSSAF